MKMRNTVLLFFLSVAMILTLGCKKNTETAQQNASAMQSNLVQAMDDYHRVLRPLMHQALPQKNMAAFKENSDRLLKQAEQLAKAAIPAKFESQKPEIDRMTQSILEKTRTFHLATQSAGDPEILETFRAAHDEYEELANVVYQL